MAMGGNPVSMIDPSGMWSYGGYNAAVADNAEAAQWAAKASSGLTNWGSSGPKMFVDGVEVYGATSMQIDNLQIGTENQDANILAYSDGQNYATFYKGDYDGKSVGVSASKKNIEDAIYNKYRIDFFDQIKIRDLVKDDVTGEFFEVPSPGWESYFTLMAKEEFVGNIQDHGESSYSKYSYNGRSGLSSSEHYLSILVDQAAKQFGITDIAALGAAITGAPILPTRGKFDGATKGTSIASKYLSKIPGEFPIRMPTLTGYPKILGGNGMKVAMTKIIGRFVGRAIPIIGWGILAYDIGMSLYNTQVIFNRITGGQ